MKNTRKKKNNFVDALANEVQYAVLTKKGRVQILIAPSPKELRKRGRRGWRLFGAVEKKIQASQQLFKFVREALELARPSKASSSKK